MSNAKRMVLTVAAWQRKNGAERPLKANRRNLGLVPSLPLPLKAGVDPIFKNIKFISFGSREAWSNKRKVLATNLGAVSDMVDNAFSRPELSHAHCTMGSINVLPHYVFNAMGFETVQRQ